MDAALSAGSLHVSPGSLTVWFCECFQILLLSEAGPLSFSMAPRGEVGTLVLPQQVGLSSVILWWEMSSLSLPSSQQACCGVWVHTVSSCPTNRSVECGPQPCWCAAFCLPCSCWWHWSLGGDHPSHQLHSSAVTAYPEQPHATEGPPQGCAFFWLE